MTKNTKRRLYYQKYLPGDIITWSYDSIDEIILIKLVTGVVGLFGSFRYETVDLELGCSLDHRYYGDRTNILVSNTDIINSTLLTSYPVNNRKGIVKRVRINESILIDFVEELYEKSIITLDFIKKKVKELVTLESLEYGVFMEYSSKEVSHFSKDLRLFQRRVYTIDSGNLNYCDQCVLSKDNCSECGVMTYNLLDSLKLLMI